jgi:hypothetical protein
LTTREISVLVVAAKWWPLSARLAIALRDHGCRVSVVCPKGHPLTHVSRLDGIFRYSGIRSLAFLRRCLIDTRPDVVIPCDDGVVAQLHALYRQDPSLRGLIERSLGTPENFPVITSRHKLLRTAVELGIPVPKTNRVGSTSDLVAWHTEEDSAVLKLDGECGGNGVRICHSVGESVSAWNELTAPRSLAFAWKRLAIDRDPLALWARRQQTEREVSIQALVRGRPANTMMACYQGQVLSLLSVIVLVADGPTGAATVVRITENAQMAQAAKLLAVRLKLTGFYGLDFMIDGSTGAPILIEFNPRCTQLGHLEFGERGSLAGAFTSALAGHAAPPTSKPLNTRIIAFFPQAYGDHRKKPGSPYADESYYDVPTQEPRLVRELLLAPWPQRRSLSRLYHLIRPITPTRQVTFDDSGVAYPPESLRYCSNSEGSAPTISSDRYGLSHVSQRVVPGTEN